MSVLQKSRPQAVLNLPYYLIFSLAVGAGLSVASIYYNQPILSLLGTQLHIQVVHIGWVATGTQVGYALGILLLVPLGDMFDRRVLILVKSLLLAIALLLCSFASGFYSLLLISLLVGVMASVAQDIIPATATLAPAQQRGKIVGTVMTGLLLGILLSRVFSGVMAQYFGWQSVFQIAAILMVIVAGVLWRVLPAMPASLTLGYGALIKSLVKLWQTYPQLRTAALSQGLLSISFSAFWSMLSIFLEQYYHLGSGIAGAFGLAGAAGALGAPIAGRLTDRLSAVHVAQGGSALVTLAFVLIATVFVWPASMQLAVLAFGAIVFDLGLQSSLIAHQSIIYSLEPQARGRLNALLFTGVFIGMASGSALGGYAYAGWGWMGVCFVAISCALLALIVRSRGR
ncbi:MFS transporter [Celerinatantimonas yamalensis]|uniref:MFS transporter n=1 Tax=Celerinatantimonas yamalensis TaxID=559956 RepID=A0ABW9G5K3_9GAMM